MSKARNLQPIAAALAISASTLLPAFAEGAATTQNPLLPKSISKQQATATEQPFTPKSLYSDRDIDLCTGCGISLPSVETKKDSSGGYLGPSLTKEDVTFDTIVNPSLWPSMAASTENDINLCEMGWLPVAPAKDAVRIHFAAPTAGTLPGALVFSHTTKSPGQLKFDTSILKLSK